MDDGQSQMSNVNVVDIDVDSTSLRSWCNKTSKMSNAIDEGDSYVVDVVVVTVSLHIVVGRQL